MKKILSIIFLMVICHTMYAYPITPRPLRKLIIESQYIVCAKVIDVLPVSDDEWSDSKAILIVQEVYQGNISMDTIEVHFSESMVCPEPAHYEKGETVLAFLDKEKDKSIYETHALSYGSKQITSEGLAIYKARITEMQAISKVKNVQIKNTETIDWLIRCATNSYTRWEGLYELKPKSGFMSYYDRGKDTLVAINHLSEKQLTTLRQSLFSIDSLSYDELELADLIEKKNDVELLGFLIDKLKQNKIKDSWFHEKVAVMQRIARISGREDLKRVYSKISEMDLNYTHQMYDETFSILLKEFINLL